MIPGALNLGIFSNVESSEGFPFPADSDLLAVWKFDEQTGLSAADASGNGLTGTLTGAALWENLGFLGGGISGNYSDYVDLGVASNLLGITGAEFCIAFWIEWDGTNLDSTNGVLWLDFGAQSSTTVASANTGLYINIDGRSSAPKLTFRIRTGSTVGYNGGVAGGWATNLVINPGRNLVICNRSSTQADVEIRNSAYATQFASIANSVSAYSWASRNNLIGARDLGGGGVNAAQRFPEEFNIPLIAAWDSYKNSAFIDQLWNNGEGNQP